MKGIQAPLPAPRPFPVASPQTFIFFLTQLHLHFTEASQASSFSTWEGEEAGEYFGGFFEGGTGAHIWQLEPGSHPLQPDSFQ